MGSSASTPRYSLLNESLRNAGVKPLETIAASCSWTLNDYINQSHVSSRWQQNGRPIPLCIKFLRSIIVEFARLESSGITHGFIGPEHIDIDDDGRLNFVYIPPPTCVMREVTASDVTYREVIRENLVLKLLGDPNTYGAEEYRHFVQTITSIKLVKNLWYHPSLQSSMEKFYFPLEAKIWLRSFCREWKNKWRNMSNKDRPYYKYTMEELKEKIGAYSNGFLRVVLDMETETKEKERLHEIRAEQRPEYLRKEKKQKNRVDVVTIFKIVRNITINIVKTLRNAGEEVMTQLQVVEALQELFPGFLLDLYDFLVRIDNANLDFLYP
ncbi:hypothetical protein ABKV19_024662 [Rosa sericea]